MEKHTSLYSPYSGGGLNMGSQDCESEVLLPTQDSQFGTWHITEEKLLT
jgi:hypothetical protein